MTIPFRLLTAAVLVSSLSCLSANAAGPTASTPKAASTASDASQPGASGYERTFQTAPEGVAEATGTLIRGGGGPAPAQAAAARPQDANRLAQVNIVGGNSGGSTAKAARPALDDDTLGQMLENLGIEVKTIELKSGGKVYRVAIERRDWNTVQYVELSPNGKYIWHTSYLAEFKPLSSAPQEKLARLLGMCGKFGPAFFQLDTSDGTLALLQAIPNNNVSPARLRELLIGFSDVIIDTAPEWQEED